MNKKAIATVSVMILCLALLAGCSAYAAGAGPAAANSVPAPATVAVANAAPTATAQGSIITEAQAKTIARENSGLAEADVQYVWVELLQKGASQEYKVEFLAAGGAKEYDYHIDAATGEIMSMDREAEKYRANGVQQALSTSAQTPASTQVQAPAVQRPVQAPAAPQTGASAQSQYIGEASAKQIALNHAGLSESDAGFVRCKLDFDDGRWEYEVELYSGATEYDYDIDAYTGDILSFDYDAEYYTPGQSLGNTAVNGTSITADQAKQIALQHAGVTESDTRRMEMDFDYEWGRAVYEFEWKSGWMEYSVDVDANTGEVVGYEQDWD